MSSAFRVSVLVLLSYVLVSFLLVLNNVLVLPLFCPELAFESAQNPFDVLAMAFGRGIRVSKILRQELDRVTWSTHKNV